jgi:hypothetical protein
MGAQGLTSALRRHCTLRPVRLTLAAVGGAAPAAPAAPAARAKAGGVLLIDASALQYHVTGRLGIERVGLDAVTDVHAAVFEAAAAFILKLQRTGLRLVFVTDSAYEPEHAASYCARRAARVADGRTLSPAVDSAFLAALLAASDCEVYQAARSADRVLLAYYKRHAADVFALLTKDSDFLVYGVRVLRPKALCGLCHACRCRCAAAAAAAAAADACPCRWSASC